MDRVPFLPYVSLAAAVYLMRSSLVPPAWAVARTKVSGHSIANPTSVPFAGDDGCCGGDDDKGKVFPQTKSDGEQS